MYREAYLCGAKLFRKCAITQEGEMLDLLFA
jgi:hypothetical protein